MLADVPDSARFRVGEEDAGLRLDVFLSARLPSLSRAQCQRLLRAGHVTLNGGIPTKPGARLRAGDEIAVTVPPPEPDETHPESLALDVLFEDADLLVLNKPAGLVVHPAAGHRSGTLVNALLHHCGALSSVGGRQRPGIVHRLDRETSGCMVVAKNDAAHHALARQFAARRVGKTYLALVAGRFTRQEGVVEAPIARHPVHRKKMAVATGGAGRAAMTSWRVVRELPGASLVECVLHTGRTHQIRVHMKHLGHPVLGDALYGSRGGLPRQMLHAWRLAFTHPRDGRLLEFEAPLPPDFVAVLGGADEGAVTSPGAAGPACERLHPRAGDDVASNKVG